MKLTSLRIKNFKSFQDISIEHLDLLTILIGVNGAGKSNILSVLDFISNALKIGINPYLHSIKKVDLTDFFYNWDINKAIEIQLIFIDDELAKYCYEFSLEHNAQYQFKVAYERLHNLTTLEIIEYTHDNLSDNLHLRTHYKNSKIEQNIYNFLINILSYNFYHSILFSSRKSCCELDNVGYLSNQYTNLVSILYNIKHNASDNYLVIQNIVKMLVPSFDDFIFEIDDFSINLRIKFYNSYISNDLTLLSEGTIRILVLSVLLNLPIAQRPTILILEEPEIALHHNVLNIIADLIDRYSIESQIMLVTQSPHLLNKVNIDNLYVLKLKKDSGESYVDKIDKNKITHWLQQYEIGELWIMNIIGGNPF